MDTRQKNIKRLYIGNLDPTIDEYALLKLFEPFGKIIDLEFLFHMIGPKKGQPRGYCFLEFDTKANTLKAIQHMHHRRIKGRSLTVSLANMTAEEHEEAMQERDGMGPARTNAAALLRTYKMTTASTGAKIQAIERKLASLQKQAPCADASSSTAVSTTQATLSSCATSSAQLPSTLPSSSTRSSSTASKPTLKPSKARRSSARSGHSSVDKKPGRSSSENRSKPY